MEFSDKYISEKENAITPNIKKTIVSNDAFALGDVIQELINKIEHTRLSLMK